MSGGLVAGSLMVPSQGRLLMRLFDLATGRCLRASSCALPIDDGGVRRAGRVGMAMHGCLGQGARGGLSPVLLHWAVQHLLVLLGLTSPLKCWLVHCHPPFAYSTVPAAAAAW